VEIPDIRSTSLGLPVSTSFPTYSRICSIFRIEHCSSCSFWTAMPQAIRLIALRPIVKPSAIPAGVNVSSLIDQTLRLRCLNQCE